MVAFHVDQEIAGERRKVGVRERALEVGGHAREERNRHRLLVEARQREASGALPDIRGNEPVTKDIAKILNGEVEDFGIKHGVLSVAGVERCRASIHKPRTVSSSASLS